MGSSPVTATIERCLGAAGAETGDLLLVAFSGGPDSTALLLALRQLAPTHGWRLLAVHVDHRLDPGSAARAAAAARLAADLGVPFRLLTAPDDPEPARREGLEARARRLRYSLLDGLRRELGTRWLVTGHHGDDQAETVLLRLAMGSGVAGLAGMSERHGALVRPLLSHTRTELAAVVAAANLDTVADPTNGDLASTRNRIRHRLLPALGGAPAAAQARSLGAAAGRLAAGLERRLVRLFPELGAPGKARLRVAALRSLPAELVPWALALLHRRAGAEYPPRRRAVAALAGQLAAGASVACDCGGGWQWRTDGEGWLRLLAEPKPAAPFAYTVEVPGRVEIREAGTTFRLSQQPVAAWMRRGAPERAALALPLEPGGSVTVRSRRPGDRLQPLGLAHGRRLKDVLIDRKVARDRRDGLPLLCLGDQVAWVPGVTIHHPFRLREGATVAWVAELVSAGAPDGSEGEAIEA